MKNKLAPFIMAFGQFTVLPVPNVWRKDTKYQMLLVLPFVGIIVGLLWYFIGFLLFKTGLHFLTAALLAVFPLIITGFMHLDGFMDCTDALMSRRPVEDMHRIMKDSSVGVFAAVSLGAVLIVSFATFLEIVSFGALISFIFTPAVSRTVAAIGLLIGKPIAHSNYSSDKKSKKKRNLNYMFFLAVQLVILLVLAFVFGKSRALFSCLATLVFSTLSMLYANRKLKGVSGDIAGWAITIGDFFAIISLSVF